jgi:hypothetical protein
MLRGLVWAGLWLAEQGDKVRPRYLGTSLPSASFPEERGRGFWTFGRRTRNG